MSQLHETRAGHSFFDEVAEPTSRRRRRVGSTLLPSPDRVPSPDRLPSTDRVSSTRTRRTGRRGALVTATVTAAAIACVVVPITSASADPSANDWLRLRICESSNNYTIDTGNNHYGAYQFDLSTWQSVGGSGYPNQASAGEQDARALILYRERGWQPWQCASILGLQEDADARSGRIDDIVVPGSGGGTSPVPPAPPVAPTAPAWPGVYFSFGDHSPQLAVWQVKMGSRGAPLTGSGNFGNNTLATVKRIQGANGLPETGLLGPVTWKLAWNGNY